MKKYRWFLTAFFLVGLAVALYAHDGQSHSSPTPTPGDRVAPSVSQSPHDGHHTSAPAEPGVIDFPNYHPLVVHFPIVLLIVATVLQIWSLFGYRRELGLAALVILIAGVISAWVASNVFHAHVTSLPETAVRLFEEHERFAAYTFWFSAAAALCKGISHFLLAGKWWSEAIVVILLLAASGAVSVTGHHGAQLVHIEGIGPKGQFLESH